MSKTENKQSHESKLKLLKEYQFIVFTVVVVIAATIYIFSNTSDDIRSHQLNQLEYIVTDQEYRLKQLDRVIEVQQIIIQRQQSTIDQMKSVLRKLVPPKKTDPDDWT